MCHNWAQQFPLRGFYRHTGQSSLDRKGIPLVPLISSGNPNALHTASQPFISGKKQAAWRSGVFSSAGQTFTRFGNGPDKAGFLDILQTLRSHLTQPSNVEYLKGCAMKYSGDVAVPALFSVPVVGWAAGLLITPFTSILSNKGHQRIEKAAADTGNKDNPFTHLFKMSNTWSSDPKQWDKSEKSVVGQLKEHYDNFIDKLLPDAKSQKVRDTLRIGEKGKNSPVFTFLEDMVDTKLRLNKSKLRHLATPFNWVHKGLSKFKFFPRALARVLLLPKFALFGLFYLARKMGGKAVR